MTPVPPEQQAAIGTVQDWDSTEGSGVLVSPEVAETVFAHFSVIDTSGYRELQPGESVAFEYTTPGQDGCAHRAPYVKTLGHPLAP